MEKERVEKTKTKEEKKLTEEKAAKVRGKKAKKAKKKPGKLHKTSIGMKIYSCMAVMGISFLIVVFANISILGTVEKNNDKLVNVYMELEQAKSVTAESYQQTAKYAESCVNRPKDVNFAGLESAIQTVRDNMDTTKKCVKKTGDKSLISRVDAWEVKMEDFLDSAELILTKCQQGDIEAASNTLSALGGPYTYVQIAQGDFEELFNSELANIEKTNTQAISRIRQINYICSGVVVFIILVMVLIVYKTIVRPTKKSGEQIRQISDKISKNEGDLTERIMVRYGDEVGQMAMGMNGFLDQLQNVMQNLKSEADNMTSSAQAVLDSVDSSTANADNGICRYAADGSQHGGDRSNT